MNSIVKNTRIIGVILLIFLMLYALNQIMTFYNIDTSQYLTYFIFFLFLLVSAFMLPRQYPTV